MSVCREQLFALSRGVRLAQVLVQAQIGHDLLEFAVLFIKVAQAPQFGRANAAIALLPDIKGRLADALLATDLLDSRTQLGLLESKGNLLLGELALLHEMLLPTRGVHHARFLHNRTVRKPGTGSK